MTTTPAHDFGQLERDGDRAIVRYSRRLPHPREKVWRAITEPEHLSAWFPTDVIGDRVAGAPLRFEFRQHEGLGFDGEMIEFEPPSLLVMRWGDDLLRFELRADGDDTLLAFTATMPEFGKAARDGAGWHACLDLLPYAISGEPAPWSDTDGDRWSEVHPRYLEQFGPEAATVAPPADREAIERELVKHAERPRS